MAEKKIKQLLLDIDNTLYPPDTGLWEEILLRINDYAADTLNLSLEEARALRESKLAQYGTTIRWLTEDPDLQHLSVDQAHYMEVVHPQDLSPYIPTDESLNSYLDSLNMPIALFTNAPGHHALRVLERLQIPPDKYPLFTIDDLQGKGKPEKEAFRKVLGKLGWDIRTTLFVDDHGISVQAYLDMGGPSLLIHPKKGQEHFPSLQSIYDLKAFLESENKE